MASISRLQRDARMSKSVTHRGVIYLSGQTASDRTQDVSGQTQEVLHKIDELLRAAGSDKSRLLSAQIWLKDIAGDFQAMNRVWEAWLAEGQAPARATAQCALANDRILVEIVVTAATSDTRHHGGEDPGSP